MPTGHSCRRVSRRLGTRLILVSGDEVVILRSFDEHHVVVTGYRRCYVTIAAVVERAVVADQTR